MPGWGKWGLTLIGGITTNWRQSRKQSNLILFIIIPLMFSPAHTASGGMCPLVTVLQEKLSITLEILRFLLHLSSRSKQIRRPLRLGARVSITRSTSYSSVWQATPTLFIYTY